jgi:cell division protein FtsB
MNVIGRSAKYIAILAGLVVLVFLVIIFNTRMANQRELVAQSEKIKTEIAVLRQTEAYLEAQIAYATSDAAVEEWAYQEARWVREGDYPVVPVSPAENSPETAPLVTPEPVVYTNWQIWWALFFDDLPDMP